MSASLIQQQPAARTTRSGQTVAPRPAPQRARLEHQLSRGEVLTLVSRLPFERSRRNGHFSRPLYGAAKVLDWLVIHPGGGWQERWVTSGADRGVAWVREITAEDSRSWSTNRDEIFSGVHYLLLARVIQPSYDFIAAYRLRLGAFRKLWRPDLFAALDESASQQGMDHGQAFDGIRIVTKIVLHTGKDIDELTADDVREFWDWHRGRYGRAERGQHAAWDLLRGIGVLSADLVLTNSRRKGQVSPAELVDQYKVRNPQIREVLVRYLEERRPGLDYTTVRDLAASLAGLFWADIEQHHPEVTSLHLPADVATAWKERIRFLKTRPGQARRDPIHTLTTVRAFYLDLQEWALEDATWAQWAAPSPVRKADTAGQAKLKRKITSEMHQRVRERLPRLPELVASAERHRASQEALLGAARAAAIGETFEHEGVTYRHVSSSAAIKNPRQYATPVALVENTGTGERIDVSWTEDDAFWTWAIIETLRHTGVRVEELLEITHLALVSYRLAGTGEIVPMLQIVPSKSNEERLLLVSPELASVLASIITRLRSAGGGSAPMVSRYDPQERLSTPPLPHLFQRPIAWRHEVISHRTVQRMLTDAVARAGLTDSAGQPLHCTPHDFRRMFATEAVSGGLPVHITARLLGHPNLATPQAYLAVFQDDLVRSYRAFLATRRAARPEAEYREPTDEEWREFQQHFELRRVELGTCGRPYGSPCKHEHACIRCPMLRVDPRQRQRLGEIILNLRDRIAEARENGWLGELEGLQVSLDAAKAKMASMTKADRVRATAADLGFPTIRDSK